MSLRPLLQKFAEGFMVSGIYLQTSQEIFPIFHEKLNSFLMLKRHLKLPEGLSEVKYEDKKYGIFIESLSENIRIIILADEKHITEIVAHWKRFSPVVQSKFHLEEFVEKESIEMKLINRLEDIRLILEKSADQFKEELKIESTK